MKKREASRHQNTLTRGFHLLEIVITLAILSIATAISIPNLAELANNSRLRRQTAELATAIERLIIQSQTERREIELILGPTYFLAQRVQGQRKGVLEYHKIRAPIVIKTRDGEKIRLLPQGVTSPTSIRLTDLNGQCQITIALRGRVTVACQ